MKTFEGINYITIGEMARLVERSTQTIKYWYKWYEEQTDEVKAATPLPPTRNDLDLRGTHFFSEHSIDALIEFRDSLNYGKMSEFNSARWGKRGNEIRERKSEPRRRRKPETPPEPGQV